MAHPYILVFCLVLLPLINTYSIDNRIRNEFDNHRFSSLKYSLASFDDCVPVQAIKELNCPWIPTTDLYHGLFESVCQRHELCYACGFLHGLTPRHCNHISQMQTFDLCQGNQTAKYDCLVSRFETLTMLEQDLFRTDQISSECSDQCVLSYIYFNIE